MKNKAVTERQSADAWRSYHTGMEALAWAASSGVARDVVEKLRARHRNRQRRRLAAAGCVALVLTVAGVISRTSTTDGLVPDAAASTSAIIAPAKRVLPDGSRMELKGEAEFAVEFSADVRRVVLRAGEAHFDVVKDPSRDFVVVAGALEVRAVGTAFSVERSETHVDVLVTEGRVEIDQLLKEPKIDERPSSDRLARSVQTIATLDAGKRLVMEVAAVGDAASAAVQAVSAVEQTQRLAWRVPRLEFSGTRLTEAISMFNQHGPVRMVIDPVLGKLQMSGVLRADDTESLLLLLKNEFGIEAHRRDDATIVLRRQ